MQSDRPTKRQPPSHRALGIQRLQPSEDVNESFASPSGGLLGPVYRLAKREQTIVKGMTETLERVKRVAEAG